MQQSGQPSKASTNNTTTSLLSQSQSQSRPIMTSAIANNSAYPYGMTFSSVEQAFINEREDMGQIDKRSAHNALERQRREGLNSKFQELALALPSLQEIRRPSKNMIVAKSLEFVTDAEKRELKFREQINQLRREHEQLIRQANLSRKRMKKRVEQDQKKQAVDSCKSPSAKHGNRPTKQTSISPASISTAIKSPKASTTLKRSREMTTPRGKLFEDLNVSANSSKRRKRQSPSMTNSGVSSATIRTTADSTQSSTRHEDQLKRCRRQYQQPLRRQSVGTITSSTSTTTTSTANTVNLPITRTPQLTTVISPANTFTTISSDDYPPLSNLIFSQEHIFYNSAFDIISAVPALGTPTIGTSHSLIQQQQQRQPSASTGMHPSSSPRQQTSADQEVHHLFNTLMQQPSPTNTSSPLSNENLYRFAY